VGSQQGWLKEIADHTAGPFGNKWGWKQVLESCGKGTGFYLDTSELSREYCVFDPGPVDCVRETASWA
jgi:hypothetical protein